MDERNRQAAQRAGRVAPLELDAAGVQRVDAGEDLDQRGLARTVLAEQRQDLAGAELEVNVIERERARSAWLPGTPAPMRSASRPLDQAPKRAAWCPSSVASRSQPARPSRVPAVEGAATLLMGLGRSLSMLFGRQPKGTRSRLHLGKADHGGTLAPAARREFGNSKIPDRSRGPIPGAQPLGEQS